MVNTGSIIKSKLTEKFTALSNELVRDKELLLHEKGLLFFLLSLPTDWVLLRKNLYSAMPAEKKGTVDSAFRGLQAKGFILSSKKMNKKGQFTGWVHYVYDVRTGVEEHEDNINREQDLPTSVLTDLGQSAPIQKKDSTLTKIEKEQNAALKKAEDTLVYNSIKKQFMDFYKLHKKEDYYWSSKDSGKVKHIIKKLAFKISEKGAVSPNPDLIIKSFHRLLCLCEANIDKWVFNNLSMAIIDSRFNEIIAQSKLKKQEKVNNELIGPVPRDL